MESTWKSVKTSTAYKNSYLQYDVLEWEYKKDQENGMYLKRKVDQYLEKWKQNNGRNPLIIKGARQIGKTESILHFAEKYYKNVVYINFVLEQKYKTVTADGYSADNIIKNISLIDPGKKFAAGETLIIFDELQEFPDIATTLKFFKSMVGLM